MFKPGHRKNRGTSESVRMKEGISTQVNGQILHGTSNTLTKLDCAASYLTNISVPGFTLGSFTLLPYLNFPNDADNMPGTCVDYCGHRDSVGPRDLAGLTNVNFAHVPVHGTVGRCGFREKRTILLKKTQATLSVRARVADHESSDLFQSAIYPWSSAISHSYHLLASWVSTGRG